MNKVILMGRLTKDVDIKSVKNGETTLGSTAIAVDRGYKDKDGNKVTDFINLKAFGKTAENLAKYFGKGNRILIEGSLNIDATEDADGNKKYYTNVIVEKFDFVETKSESNASAASASKPDGGIGAGFASSIGNDEELPFM